MVSFRARVWRHEGPASWWFVSLPRELSRKTRQKHGFDEEGWGRLKVTATVGTRSWDTAIWYDTKRGCYLLPLKAEIRKQAKIAEGQLLSIGLRIATGLEK